MAEAAHQQGATARALALVGKAQAFAGSRMRRLMDQDLLRYRRQDRRPGRLLAALGAAGDLPGDPFPPPWSAALARLRSATLGRPDLDLGVVGRWRFDETRQTPAADGSGLGHTGALINFTAADRRAGRRGQALAYQPARRTVVLIGDSDELDPRDELTVAAWVKPIDWKGNRRVLQKGAGDNQYRLTAEDGELRFEVLVEAGGGGTRRLTASAPLPPEDAWVHLAGTYDGARLRLLVNAAEVDAAPADGARLQITRDPLVIGGKRASDSTTSNGFHGLIDEVVLYDRALTDEELRQLAHPGGTRLSIDVGR
jgi:Concanavalin A-like lectin/glucanases superfamily